MDLGLTSVQKLIPNSMLNVKKTNSYEIPSINYFTLSDDEKIKRMQEWWSILQSMESPIDITMLHRPAMLDDGRQYRNRQTIFTSNQNLHGVLLNANLSPTILDTPYKFHVKEEYLDHLVFDEGTLCRMYMLYKMPYSMEGRDAFINNIFYGDGVGAVQIHMKPMTMKESHKALSKHASTITMRNEMRYKVEGAEARALREQIDKSGDFLMQVSCSVMVFGSNKKELNEYSKMFRRSMGWQYLGFTTIKGKQRSMLNDITKMDFIVNRLGSTLFYPFESADLIENGPGGVFLGSNIDTASPVVYNYLKRNNSNIVFLGSSGSGKSTTTKTYISNYLEMIQRSFGDKQRVMISIIDPHGEYEVLAREYGCEVVDLEKRTPMGLDPFKVYTNPSSAAGILADASEMPPDIRSVAINLAKECKSLEEYVEFLKSYNGQFEEDAKKVSAYLAQFITGDIARIFSGDPYKNDKTVFVLKNADRSSLNAMIVSLVMGSVWRSFVQEPVNVQKLLILDEAWFITTMATPAAQLGTIARSGRKHNVNMLFMTQHPSDMIENDAAANVMGNSDTIFAMRMNSAEIQKLAKVLHFSDMETSAVEKLQKGQALLRASDYKIRVAIEPTKEQLELFNTAPPGANETMSIFDGSQKDEDKISGGGYIGIVQNDDT